MRTRVWCLALLPVLGGCGLVLDVGPQDAPVGFDAGAADAARADAGRSDAGRSDAALDAGRDASATDAASVEDAALDDGAADAQIDAGDPTRSCRTSGECPAGAFCARAFGVCYGPGTCMAAARACPDVHAPVCGCDWSVYGNDCAAAAAGVNVMQAGACPPIGADGGWCPLPRPTTSDPGGCPHCFDDADCGTTLAPICVASGCATSSLGVCAFGRPPLGRCYDARQCNDGQRCEGATIDVCPPLQGRCVAR